MKTHYVKNNYGVIFQENDIPQTNNNINNYNNYNYDKVTNRISSSFSIVNRENNQAKKYKNIYQPKAIMLGSISVGKTSILGQLIDNKFNSDYICSLGVEFKLKSIPIDDKSLVDLQIWDTCGQERFKTITRSYYISKDACILVFDLTSKKTFLDLEKWLYDINTFGPKNILNIIVGNKYDLENQREVEFEEAEEFAKKNNCDYFEVSAKTGYGLNYTFDILSRSIIENMKEEVDNDKIKIDNVKLLRSTQSGNKGSGSKCC